MTNFLRRAWLPVTVFLTGACVLVIEIVATRILAPYFGNTMYSVSSVISVVLAALSVGYWFGGRLADRYPSKKLFFGIIAISGLLVLFMQFAQVALLGELGYKLPLDIGPLIMSIILFFVPSFVLGTLSPFAVALLQKETKGQGVGTTAGQIFFFSTLGSIAGSLLAGFVLIPLFGVSTILVSTGLALFLLGALPVAVLGIERKFTVTAVLLACGLLTLSTSVTSGSQSTVYAHDGRYEKIVIFDGQYRGRPARFLQQDTSNSGAMYLDSDELTYEYTKYYSLYQMFVPELKHALAIGGGAYSVPKALLASSPDITVDVSEIEPSLPELAKKYFGLQDNVRLTHYVMDGRRMLHDTPNRYDLIFSDAYHSLYSAPAHLTTKEFMELAHNRLNKDGVFIANLIGSVQADGGVSYVWSQIRTMKEVFPQVYVFAVRDTSAEHAQNIIAVGSTNPERLDVYDTRWIASSNSIIANIAEHYVDTAHIDFARYPILTDNYAPVDYLTSKVLPER